MRRFHFSGVDEVDHVRTTATLRTLPCGVYRHQLCNVLAASYLDVSTLSAAGDVQTESTDMPPPTDTQLPLKRKRGRPPQTPTKGPVSKQSKASDAAASHDNAPVDAARRDDNVGASNTGVCDVRRTYSWPQSFFSRHVALLVYRTLNGVPEKDRTEWITERAPLFDEDEIARLCNDPLNETLTPAHVDTILQHIVLFHKRPVLIVSSAHSAAFDANLRALGFDEDMPKSERNHLAAAAIPALPDGFLFGDKSSFEVVILPVYGPGHYVGTDFPFNALAYFVGTRHLRRRRR